MEFECKSVREGEAGGIDVGREIEVVSKKGGKKIVLGVESWTLVDSIL